MASPRFEATATLLSDGRVLVAGGDGAVDAYSSAELYDPASGEFSATGSMTVPRVAHSATRLVDGKVLVVGGIDKTQSLDSAELYDPATGRFTAVGSIYPPLAGGAAIRLLDGNVLVVAGADQSAQLYDPSTECCLTRTATTQCTHERQHGSACIG